MDTYITVSPFGPFLMITDYASDSMYLRHVLVISLLPQYVTLVACFTCILFHYHQRPYTFLIALVTLTYDMCFIIHI